MSGRFTKSSSAFPVCTNLWEMKLAHKAASLKDQHDRSVQFQQQAAANKILAYDLWEPAWSCHIERRLGKPFGDGGKFVCGSDEFFQTKGCLAYSVGSNGDSSFEKAIREHFGCEIHTFDPKGNSTQYEKIANVSGSSFHAWGLSNSSGSLGGNPLLTLGDIANRLGHAHRHIDIFKIDCEGCEYLAFDTIWSDLKSSKYSIGQIQIELHGTDFKKLKTFFDAAEGAGFVIFHKERNHWGCNGYSCVEFSLIHMQQAEEIFRHTHC